MVDVPIVRSKSTDESRLGEMVEAVLEPLGGLGKYVEPGDAVILKPNLVTNRKYFTGATTDPLIIQTLIRGLKSLGVADITVADSSWTGCSTKRAFIATGINGICDREGVKLLDLKKDKFVDVDVPKGKELGGSVAIARTILEADKIINVPKLKAHSQTLVTLSLKNLKGCIADSEKQRFHRLDLDKCIAELNTVLRSDLIVLDAIVGEMTAELGCDPVRLDTMVAGTNPVAMDALCATILGYEPHEISHIAHAEALGIGRGLDLSEINVFGDVELAQLKGDTGDLIGYQRYTEAFEKYGLSICDDGACSSCLSSLYLALKRMADDELLETLKNSKIYLGQKIEQKYPKVQPDKAGGGGVQVGIGKCTEKIKGLDFVVKGCPPTALKVYKKLRKC
jgi:uncharacterized protein (DUF362 family)